MITSLAFTSCVAKHFTTSPSSSDFDFPRLVSKKVLVVGT